jgi:hypothetical protein
MSIHNQVTEVPARTCDLRDASANFAELHRRVIESGRRVEIVPDNGSASSVLISKAELECLERAVEILGDSDAVKALCGEIAMLASRAGGASAQA